ncbi:hypothetical protein Flavo103_08500 [Flavobacterium collinsii]|uniref:hypothetical protein n=1 Tax=Flavobacterium collinsii TaxID=1114861 RepID=UPI0022BF72E0|nr:hypothetical protein [Flavobacterium collinsii]GIQ57714.1 hypothetical protein Flavo103_08500 [Flavobacterium collinsii]
MENRITLRNFGYEYSVGRNTIKAYKEEYYNSLHDFLSEYEDNTEDLFLNYLIPEWDDLLIEFKNAVDSIKNNDTEVFYFIRNRIHPDGLPEKEDSEEVKSIINKLEVTESEELKLSLYKQLEEIWRKESEEEEKSSMTSNFFNWREVENEELEKKDCIKLLNRNIATGFLFIDFLKKRQKEIQIQQSVIFDLRSKEEITSTVFEFRNNFDHVQSKTVFNYFKAELVDKNYLSLEDLHKYLIIAFQNKIVPNERFVLKGNFTIGIIRNIFYKYYTEIAQDKFGKKNEYCQLLGEYFNGFDTAKIKRNFNK